jgi:hypothetical protein
LAWGKDHAVSDAEGYWAVKNVPPTFDQGQNRLEIQFFHPDYLSIPGEEPDWQQPIYPGAELRSRTLVTTLKPGIRLSGVVWDSSGKPVPGAVIIRGDEPTMQLNSREVRCDDQGRYLLPALAEGPLTLVAVAPGYAPQMREFHLSQKTRLADFVLGQGHTIRLKITDEFGQPIKAAYVDVDRWRDHTTLHNERHDRALDNGIPDRANEWGIYTWDFAPHDPVTYYIYAQGFQPEILTIPPTENAPPKPIMLKREINHRDNLALGPLSVVRCV